MAPTLVLVASATAYAWPLLGSLTTAIPGSPTDLDVATMVWNVGYVFHALASGGDLLHTQDVVVPFGADLRLHTYGLLQGLAAVPIAAVGGAVAAFNLMLVLTLALNGIVAYLLILRESHSRAAALVAAACCMLAFPVLDQLRVGRPTFASVWIVAGALLAARSLVEQPRLGSGLGLGLVLLAAALTDFQIVLFCGIWLASFGLARFRWCHRAPLLLAALVFGVPFGLLFYPALQGAAAAGYPQPSTSDTLVYAYRLRDYLDPEVVPRAYGFELGGAALIAAVLSVYRRLGRGRLWLVGSLVCLVLALGPSLQPTTLPLPFALFGAWPPLAQFRTPYRLTLPAVLGLSVVLGLLLARLFRRWPRSRRSLVAGLLVLARLGLALGLDPLETQTYPTYGFYAQVAGEPGRFALVEVPFGVRSGLERIGTGGEALEYYQSVHGKPILNGMIARLPATVFAAYAAHPALQLLAGDDVSDIDSDAHALDSDLAQVMDWVGARYVLVHHRLLEPAQAERIDAFLDRQAWLERLATEADLAVYRDARRAE